MAGFNCVWALDFLFMKIIDKIQSALVERFHKFTKKDIPPPSHAKVIGNCWEWPSTSRRYPCTTAFGVSIKSHHLAWEIYKGEIEDGKHVLHYCDNNRCCNPDHLWLGTHQDNMEDARIKKRSGGFKTRIRNYQINPPIGELHGKTSLTEKQVLEIRRKHSFGKRGADLGREYGVRRDVIHKITTRKTWKHI